VTAYSAAGSVRAPETPTRDSPGVDVTSVRDTADAIVRTVEQAIEGKRRVVQLALAVLLSGGHLLIEDVPGVGKTTLAKALARSIDGQISRIQFTPDLLPSDVIGVSVYNQDSREFEFKPGAVFSHLLVADEINRASPKTQSALLECMEEHQVTADGVTYRLENPFMVIATQNPIEMEGTYPLPEAQRDRFTARIAMGYPDPQAEVTMLDGHASADPIEAMKAVSSPAEIARLVELVSSVYISSTVKQYVVNLVNATRASSELRLGASPRAALQLVRTARAIAALEGRDFVVPDDVATLASPVLAHRLLLDPDARANGTTGVDVIDRLVARTPMSPNGRE
jgi:MoxR-like ATPase